MCSDEFSLRYSDLVTGSYECLDRIVFDRGAVPALSALLARLRGIAKPPITVTEPPGSIVIDREVEGRSLPGLTAGTTSPN